MQSKSKIFNKKFETLDEFELEYSQADEEAEIKDIARELQGSKFKDNNWFSSWSSESGFN